MRQYQMDGFVGFLGVGETMVGGFDRAERDAVFLSEGADGVEGDDLVLGSVDDNRRVFDRGEVSDGDIVLLKLADKVPGDLYLSVKADEDRLALAQRREVVVGHDPLGQDIIHIDRGTAQRDGCERISEIGDVFQKQISAEAVRAAVELFGLIVRFYIVDHRAQIGHTVGQAQPAARVVAVTRPVEDDQRRVGIGYPYGR